MNGLKYNGYMLNNQNTFYDEEDLVEGPYKHTPESYSWWLKCKEEREGIVINDPTKTVNLVPFYDDTNITEEEINRRRENWLKLNKDENIIVPILSKEEFRELEKKGIMLEWERLINEK